jgi:predicted Zn finger-like uncharacterized protein
MSVTVDCPHCDRSLKVSESLDGQEVKCPGCKKRLVVRFDPTAKGTTTSIPPAPASPFDPLASCRQGC